MRPSIAETAEWRLGAKGEQCVPLFQWLAIIRDNVRKVKVKIINKNKLKGVYGKIEGEDGGKRGGMRF